MRNQKRPSPAVISLDPLAEIFLHSQSLGNNINSMQAVVVAGRIELGLLKAAVAAIGQRFPLLLSRPDLHARRLCLAAYSPADIPCQQIDYPNALSFESANFRRLLTSLNRSHPVIWQQAPPIRFWLIQGSDGRSCILISISHAVADAQADSMMFDALMKEYGRLRTGQPPSAVPSSRQLDDLSLDALLGAGQRGRVARRVGQALLRALAGSLKPSAHPPGTPPRASAAQECEQDFVRELVPIDLQTRLHACARRTGHTINSLVMSALCSTVSDWQGTSAAPLRVMMPFSLRSLLRESGDSQAYRNLMLPCWLDVCGGEQSRQLSSITSQVKALRQGDAEIEVAKVALVNWLLRKRYTRKLGAWFYERLQRARVAYSNPGVIAETLSSFGTPDLEVIDYIGVGCVVPPLDFILYTPTRQGRLELNAIYRVAAFTDFRAEILQPLRQHLEALAAKYLDAQAPLAVARA